MRWWIGIILALVAMRYALRYGLPAAARIRRPRNLRERIMVRYQDKDFAAWVFAWWKTGLDAMFGELPEILKSAKSPTKLLDLGCGYGLAGCLVLESLPGVKVIGIDPNPTRVAAATAAFEGRGSAFVGAAPAFEPAGVSLEIDAAMALDIIHFLDDAQLMETLRRIRTQLRSGDPLIIRSLVRDGEVSSWRKRVYVFTSDLRRIFYIFRSVDRLRELIQTNGFEVSHVKISGKNRELFWFIASASAVPEKQPAQDQQQKQNVQNDQAVAVHGEKLVDLLQSANSAEPAA